MARSSFDHYFLNSWLCVDGTIENEFTELLSLSDSCSKKWIGWMIVCAAPSSNSIFLGILYSCVVASKYNLSINSCFLFEDYYSCHISFLEKPSMQRFKEKPNGFSCQSKLYAKNSLTQGWSISSIRIFFVTSSGSFYKVEWGTFFSLEYNFFFGPVIQDIPVSSIGATTTQLFFFWTFK